MESSTSSWGRTIGLPAGRTDLEISSREAIRSETSTSLRGGLTLFFLADTFDITLEPVSASDAEVTLFLFAEVQQSKIRDTMRSECQLNEAKQSENNRPLEFNIWYLI